MSVSDITVSEKYNVRHRPNNRRNRKQGKHLCRWPEQMAKSLRLHYQQKEQRLAARKDGEWRTRRDSVWAYLHNTVLPKQLHGLLCNRLRQHRHDLKYDIADALIDILTTLEPDSDAGRDARWVGSEAGIPVEHLLTREELLAWLEGHSTNTATHQIANQPASVATVSGSDNNHLAAWRVTR